jgi:hypothetical protein
MAEESVREHRHRLTALALAFKEHELGTLTPALQAQFHPLLAAALAPRHVSDPNIWQLTELGDRYFERGQRHVEAARKLIALAEQQYRTEDAQKKAVDSGALRRFLEQHRPDFDRGGVDFDHLVECVVEALDIRSEPN